MEESVEWELAGEAKCSEKTCLSATLSTTNSIRPELRSNLGRRSVKPATNRPSYDTASTVHSRRRNSLRKQSASPQLTARSGQSAQLVQGTHCIRTHVNLHSRFGHPYNGTRITWSLHDFILRAKEIPRAFVYDDFFVSANGLQLLFF
jgi:hypothetical protein